MELVRPSEPPQLNRLRAPIGIDKCWIPGSAERGNFAEARPLAVPLAGGVAARFDRVCASTAGQRSAAPRPSVRQRVARRWSQLVHDA